MRARHSLYVVTSPSSIRSSYRIQACRRCRRKVCLNSACPELKSLQTLGLAVDGSGRSQPQDGKFANAPASHCRSSQNPVDGRDVLSHLRSLLRCTIRNVIGCRRRLPSPAVAQSSGICRLRYHRLPITRNAVGHDVTTMAESARAPSDQTLSRRDASIVTIRTIAVISIAVFPPACSVGITASGSMFNAIRLGAPQSVATYTDSHRPSWERGEVQQDLTGCCCPG